MKSMKSQVFRRLAKPRLAKRRERVEHRLVFVASVAKESLVFDETTLLLRHLVHGCGGAYGAQEIPAIELNRLVELRACGVLASAVREEHESLGRRNVPALGGMFGELWWRSAERAIHAMPLGVVAKFDAVICELAHRHAEETHQASDLRVLDLC